jgi:hypothetical protein
MNDRPSLPAHELRAALGDDPEGSSTLDALHAELQSERPSRARIDEHVDTLRSRAPLRAVLANWFDDPRTQAFLEELNAAGL